MQMMIIINLGIKTLVHGIQSFNHPLSSVFLWHAFQNSHTLTQKEGAIFPQR